MEQNQFASNPLHQKGKHLNFEERVVIQTRLRDGWSFRKIAREITQLRRRAAVIFPPHIFQMLSFGQILYREKFFTTPLLRNFSSRNLILP